MEESLANGEYLPGIKRHGINLHTPPWNAVSIPPQVSEFRFLSKHVAGLLLRALGAFCHTHPLVLAFQITLLIKTSSTTKSSA